MPSKLSRGEVLAAYEHEIKTLRKLGLEWNIHEDQIDQILQDSFGQLTRDTSDDRNSTTNKPQREKKHNYCLLMAKVFILICIFIFTIVLLTYHKPTYNLVVRNVQELIYPSMKVLRFIALPFVRAFPSITVWYDELCLLENPYFRASDINCWPCEDVRSILDLTETSDPKLYQPHSAFPFIVKGAGSKVSFADIEAMYNSHKPILDQDASTIVSSTSQWNTIAGLMEHGLEQNPTPNQNAHISWRLNRLEPARVIRRLFPRPTFVPNTINVERFLLIDEPKAPQYSLPFPEGYKVFLLQGSGERLVVLEPVPGCAANCTRVSVLLKPSYVLYYSSWFYQPKSHPVANSSSVALTYIISH